MLKIVLLTLVSIPLYAQLVDVYPGDIFQGKEIYNHGMTGKLCSVEVLSVESHEAKGVHCSKIKLKYNFETKTKKQPKNTETIYSARAAWRGAQISCASLIDPDDDAEKVFGQDSTDLFNEMFSGAQGGIWNRSSYFLVFGNNRLPKEAMMSNVRPSIERTWTCANLYLDTYQR